MINNCSRCYMQIRDDVVHTCLPSGALDMKVTSLNSYPDVEMSWVKDVRELTKAIQELTAALKAKRPVKRKKRVTVKRVDRS